MNTYNISVNGVTILDKISQEEVQENLKLIRGLVWTSGGKDQDITVTLNKNENPLQ
jgi:hypothetical protein